MDAPTEDLSLLQDAARIETVPPKTTGVVPPRRINPIAPALMVIGLFVSLRIGLSTLAWAAVAFVQLPANWSPELARWVELALRPGDQLYYVVGPWQRWDALWYEKIATYGYATDGSTHFFPLFPLSMRLVGVTVESRWALAGMVVAGLSLLVGLFVIWRGVATETNPGVAWRTILYMSVFPTAFFFFAPYSESLFLCLVATSFYCARRGRWWLAGAVGFLAALTQGSGLALVVPLAWEYGHQNGWRFKALLSRDLLSVALIPAATLLFGLYSWLLIGQSFLGVTAEQQGWEQSVTWPWQTLWESLHLVAIVSGPTTNYLDFAVTLAFLALSLACFRYLPASYGLLSLALLLPRLFFAGPETPLMSASRYVLVAFPCFVIPAMVGRHRLFNRLYLAASILGLCVLTAFFVRWVWIA